MQPIEGASMKNEAPKLTRTLIAVAVAALFVTACGGGKDESTPTTQAPASGPTAAPTAVPTDQEAVRFLSQATMGASAADVAHMKQIGFNNWIEEQFAAPRTSHLDFVVGEIGLDVPPGHNHDRPAVPLMVETGAHGNDHCASA
jgi:hypothetical protein